jgi:transcriptional/translational regulatory protein YebC/TACO1
MLYGPFEEFGNISRGLDEKGLEILESGTEYIPNITKEITPEQQAEVEKMLEKFEEDDDVQNVYHTMG